MSEKTLQLTLLQDLTKSTAATNMHIPPAMLTEHTVMVLLHQKHKASYLHAGSGMPPLTSDIPIPTSKSYDGQSSPQVLSKSSKPFKAGKADGTVSHLYRHLPARHSKPTKSKANLD